MLPFFGWRAAALAALLLQAIFVAALPGLNNVTWYPKASLSSFPSSVVSSLVAPSLVAASSATVNSITTSSRTRRVLTRSTTSTITPTMIVPVTITISAGASSSVRPNGAVAFSDVAFVETAVVTDVVVVDPVAGSTYTTELPVVAPSSSSSSSASGVSSTMTTTSASPQTRPHRTFIKTTVTSRPVGTTTTTETSWEIVPVRPTTTETVWETLPTVTVLEAYTSWVLWPASDKKGPILTIINCNGKPYRVHSFHNPFSKPFGCPKPKPKCPKGRKCHSPPPEDLEKRTVHMLDATPGPVTLTSDSVSVSTTTSTAFVTKTLSDSGAAPASSSSFSSSSATGSLESSSSSSHRRTLTRTTSTTTTPPAVVVTVTATTVTAPIVTKVVVETLESTLEQAKKGCIECADTKDNGLIPPESLVNGQVPRVGKRSNAEITPIQLAPVSNGTLVVSDPAPTAGLAAAPLSRRRSRASGPSRRSSSLVARDQADESLPHGPFSIYDDPILPMNFTFSETLLPLNKTAFIEYFNLYNGITDPTKGPLYNVTLLNSPSSAVGVASGLDNDTSSLGTSAISNGNGTATLPAIDTSSLSHDNGVDKRSSACNCAHNSDAHSWRDTMSPVERATEICIAGGGCKVTRDYEELCVMVGSGPDPCACIAGAVGDYQSHHRGVWWLWSAVHCGGSAVLITNR